MTKTSSTSSLRVGIAGWSIARQHASLFDQGESMLARYATRLSVAEINSSFYRPHQRKTYQRWADSVPASFRFSVKLPQTITHELGLRGAGPTLDRFLDEVGGLGRKLGGLLMQLPPGLGFDARTASTFFRMLRARTDLPVACEPRHAEWFSEQADAMLRRHGVARVAADPARVPQAALPGGDPGWRYWRWHGSPRIYYSEYGDAALAGLAAQVREYGGRGTRTWVIFDNTAHGFAIPDALRLQALTGRAAKAQPRQRRR